MIRPAACLFAGIFLCALARAQTVDTDLGSIYATEPAKLNLSHQGDLSRRTEAILQQQVSALVKQLHPWEQDPAAPPALLLYHGASTEVDIRSNAHLVFGLAVLHRATSDVEARDKAIAILRFLLPTHGAGDMKCADGKQWHNQWQSAYWAYSAGKAAWILWDQLDPKLKWLAARMVCDEADRFVNKKPPTQVERDTKAEENAWDSTIVALAYNMFPKHPHHESWRETAIRWQISSFVTAADVKSTEVIDGKPLNEWLTGANIHDDYTLENHDRVHPDYMGTTRINLYQELIYAWAGNAPPAAIRYNVEKIYTIEKKLSLPDGSLIYPNAEDWQLHRNADWIDLHTMMSVRFNDPQAARLARLNLEAGEKMMARKSELGIHLPGETIVNTTHAVLIELYAYAYLLMRAAGEGPPPVVESQLWKDLAGTYVFDIGKFALVRGEHAVATFSWGRQVMGLTFPLQKDLLLTPNDRGMIGIVKVEGKKRESPVVKRVEVSRLAGGGFSVSGIAARGLDGSIEQRFAFLALPDGRTIYADDWPPTAELIERIPLGVLNDVNWIYHDGKRTVHFPGGWKVFPAAESANAGDVALPSPWYNLDDSLGIVCLQPVGQPIYHAKPSPIRARLEQIFALNSAAAVFYPSQTVAQTREVANRCKLEPLNSPRDLTIVLDDGKRVHVDLENLEGVDPMKHCLLFVVVLALFAPLLRAAEAPFFPLGLWYEGGVGDARDNVLPKDPAEAAKVYERDFADIEAHGINVITIPNSPPDHHKIVLDTAQKHHLKVILELGLDGGPFGHMIRGQRPMDDAAIKAELDNVFAKVKDHPALLRVQLLDEPPADALVRYGQIAEAVRKYDPKVPSFCCLTGDSNGDKFLTESNSDVVAFDMYPLGPGVKEGDAKPMKDFAMYAQRFADWADQHNASSWAVVQCHDITGQLRLPTAGELRCMTYASLATGNRGVFWFLYQSEHVGPGTLMGGLVDRDFKPRPLWDEIAKLSKEIAPLTATLAKLKPGRKTKVTISNGASAWVLRDGEDNAYVFAVNMDSEKEQKLEISIPAAGNEVQRINDGGKIASTLKSGVLKWSDTLPAGGGGLYRID